MLHAPSGAYRTRKRISKTPAFISKCRKALYRSDPPHQSFSLTLARQLPHRGKPFGWADSDYTAFPWGKGDREERAVDEGPFMRLRANIERECVYRKRLRLYRNAVRHYIVQTPLITAYAELPHRGGKPFGLAASNYPAFPGGEGGPRGTSGG